ncbi:GlcG/HbpS family heme-binding protein [Trinickia fusca]|nr:heme-binding protein [Trinickia fusca]
MKKVFTFAFAVAAAALSSSAIAGVESTLTLQQAIDATTEALHACAAKGYKVAVTVVDPDGVIKLQARGDDSPIHSRQFSFRKAFTVMSMGPMVGGDSSSGVIQFINSKNPAGTATVGAASPDLLFLPGAVLLK